MAPLGPCSVRGLVSGIEFEVTPIIRSRNSFLPTISGIVEPTANGARVSGTMRVHPLVIAFMVFWLAVVGAGCLDFVRRAVSTRTFELGLIPAGFMVAFGLILPIAGFLPAARKALRQLTEIANGKVTSFE